MNCIIKIVVMNIFIFLSLKKLICKIVIMSQYFSDCESIFALTHACSVSAYAPPSLIYFLPILHNETCHSPRGDNYLPAFIRMQASLSSGSPGHRWSLHFLTSSPVPSHCCPVTAAPWHTRARLCHPPSQDFEQPLHGPHGFHWPLAVIELNVRERYLCQILAGDSDDTYRILWSEALLLGLVHKMIF